MLLKPINLALVDDHAMFRKALRNFLIGQINMNVVLQSSNILDLISKLSTCMPDILLLDVFMPDLNGNEAVKTLRSEFPSIKIIILSMSRDIDMISDMLDAGIHGFISKSDEPEELLQAIRAVAENRIHLNKLLTEAMCNKSQHYVRSYMSQSGTSLTEREKRILQLLWEEKSNKEISDELFLGIRSVEKIRQDMKGKLGIRSTVGLLKYALHEKIISVGANSSGIVV